MNLPTRLELHRLKRRFMGKGPLLLFFSLSKKEKDILLKDLYEHFWRGQGVQDNYQILGDVLEEWGVQCYHPREMRIYEGKQRASIPQPQMRWFECQLCGCYCPNDEPLASVTFSAEQPISPW